MIVHKFGGTSLGDAERIREAARLVAACGGPCVVIVSALAGVTDQLLELAEEVSRGAETEVAERLGTLRRRHDDVAQALVGDTSQADQLQERIDAVLSRLQQATAVQSSHPGPTPGFVDEVSAIGEDLAVELVAVALRLEGLAAEVVDARTVVCTDALFGGAVPRDEETMRRARQFLTPLVEQGKIPVLQGFVAATPEGVTTTLGRGGSDFTAAIVGAALGSAEVSIWTDVDGVMSADPQQVSGAQVLPELGYEEAVELAYFGAKVIHPAAAKHAVAASISLRIRNLLRPKEAGTLIRPDRRRAAGVAAIAYKPQVTLMKVRSRPMFMAYGFLARVFEVLARHQLPVDLVATSHTSTAFTIDSSQGLNEVSLELGEFAEVEIIPGLATVSIVGHGLLQRLGLAARVFSALGQRPVYLISQASDVCLSFLVESGDAPGVVRRLHSNLVESAE